MNCLNLLNRFNFIVCLAAMLLACSLVAAQQEEAPSAESEAVAAAPDGVTIESVQTAISSQETAETTDEAAQDALELYKQALADLQNRREMLKKAEEFSQAGAGAASRMDEIQADLDKSTAVPTAAQYVDMSRDDLAQALIAAQAQQASAVKLRDDLQAEATNRAQRRQQIPGEIAAAQSTLDSLQQTTGANGTTGAVDIVAEARRIRDRAAVLFNQALIQSLTAELQSYDARQELLPLRRRLADQRAQRIGQEIAAIQEAINTRQREEADRQLKEAERARRDAANQHPLLQQVAEENEALARENATLSSKLDDSLAQLQRVEQQLSIVRTQFEAAKEREQRLGSTSEAIGLLLRKHRTTLPNIRDDERQIDQRAEAMSDIQLELILREEEARELENLDRAVDSRLDSFTPALSSTQRDELRPFLREQLQNKQQYLATLTKNLDKYFENNLAKLNERQQELVAVTEQYREYIDERILGIQSAPPISFEDLSQSWAAIANLIDPEHWTQAGRNLWIGLKSRWVSFAPFVVVWLILLVLGRRLRQSITELGKQVGRASTDTFEHTVRTTIYTILIAACWPLLLLLLSRLLLSAEGGSSFTEQVGFALQRTAMPLFMFELLRQVCRPGGLGQAHFRWRPNTLKLVRRNLVWFMPISLVLVFIAYTTVSEVTKTEGGFAGRLPFMASMLAVTVLFFNLFHPNRGVFSGYLARHRGGWFDRLRWTWFLLIVLVPIIFVGLAAMGYIYTAGQFTRRVAWTIWLILGVVIGNSFFVRWLYVAQRKLAAEQARKRREAMAAEQRDKPRDETMPVESPVAEVDELNVTLLSTQARKLLRSVLAFALVLGAWAIWVDILPALNLLRQVELWSQVTEVTRTLTIDGVEEVRTIQEESWITLADVVLSLIILLITVLVARNIPGLLEITLLQRLPIHTSVRYAISTIIKYLITIIGIVIAFYAIGVTWSKVQFLAAAVTVGLGFGLQEIFANFVSGLILLFERPIRIGDTVTIGEVSGTVSRIRIRATTVVDANRKELIIPNKEFITGRIINWSLTDSIVRITIPVGIAYGSDTKLAHDLLLQAADETEGVLDDPRPIALFNGFGASSLDFELRIFIPNLDYFISTRHGLHMLIDQKFRAAGIEIAFPQRDLHIRSISGELPIRATSDDIAERLRLGEVELADS